MARASASSSVMGIVAGSCFRKMCVIRRPAEEAAAVAELLIALTDADAEAASDLWSHDCSADDDDDSGGILFDRGSQA